MGFHLGLTLTVLWHKFRKVRTHLILSTARLCRRMNSQSKDEPMSVWCGASVVDSGPALKRHWVSGLASQIKHETLTQCCFNVVPSSPMLAQRWNCISWRHRVFMAGGGIYWTNIVLILGHRLRRWPKIKPILDQCFKIACRLMKYYLSTPTHTLCAYNTWHEKSWF